MSDYEKIVMEHYNEVAKQDKDSQLSTMKNEYIRERETNAILNTIAIYMKDRKNENPKIIDIGCGNGYTLEIIHKTYPKLRIYGIEKNDELRRIAVQRFIGVDNVEVSKGDILCDLENIHGKADIVYCQRVLINLLDENDQKLAISNIGNIVNKYGVFFCIEGMKKPLETLNSARNEYGLKEIKESYHNMYMKEDVFDSLDGYTEWKASDLTSRNFLSTHYYITRVLHDITLQGMVFERNSHFVKFFTEALRPDIGEYSPLQFFAFMKEE